MLRAASLFYSWRKTSRLSLLIMMLENPTKCSVMTPGFSFPVRWTWAWKPPFEFSKLEVLGKLLSVSQFPIKWEWWSFNRIAMAIKRDSVHKCSIFLSSSSSSSSLGLTMWLWLAQTSLCRPHWLWTHRNQSASTFKMLGLKMYATKSDQIFLLTNLEWHKQETWINRNFKF